MPRLLPALLLLLALVVGAGCDALPGEEAALGGDLYERLQRKRDFQALTDALDDAGQGDLLRSGAPVTVLAPTDAAFEHLGGDLLAVLARPDHAGVLARVLRHHVIAGRLAPDDFVDGDTLRSVDGRPLPVRRVGPVVRVGGATLDLTEPVEADGAVAYPAADVLLGALSTRERVALSPSLSRFRAYAAQAGLLDRAAGPVTVLAPLDDAFAALGGVAGRLFALTSNADVARQVLDLHVVPGVPELVDGRPLTSVGGDPLAVRVEGAVRTVGGRRVLREEATADGRLLVLGGVVLDPLSLAERLRIEPAALLYWREVRDRLPGLWSRLGDDGEGLTVFAPTDFAYQLRGAALNGALADAANAALNERLLRVHVVEGRYGPGDLTDGLRLVTVDGTVLTVGRRGGVVTLDGRRVGAEPRAASNGVLYTMDGFVHPTVDALDTALLRGYTEHVVAVRRAGLEAAFRAPGVTAFVASDSLHLAAAGRLQADPGPFLLYNATAAALPRLGNVSFTALDGSERSIRIVPCDPEGGDDLCSPFQFADGVQIYQGSPANDGTGYLHQLRALSFPPGF